MKGAIILLFFWVLSEFALAQNDIKPKKIIIFH